MAGQGSAESTEDMNVAEEIRSLDLLVGRLVQRFPAVEPRTIRDVVTRAHEGFDGAPIRDYVPVLVEHEAVAVLRGSAVRPQERALTR